LRLTLRPPGGRRFGARLESVEAGRRVTFAYDGEFVQGRGEWTLALVSNGTEVAYTIDATVAGYLAALVNTVLRLDRPHSYEMRRVLAALRRELDVNGC
jgi:carbon monoxide dehydrogenase subunit G